MQGQGILQSRPTLLLFQHTRVQYEKHGANQIIIFERSSHFDLFRTKFPTKEHNQIKFPCDMQLI